MSLFDVIRYPVSMPPGPGELEALPVKLFRCWIDKHTVNWFEYPVETRYNAYNVGDWMRSVFRRDDLGHNDEIKKDIHSLRKLIVDWHK